MLTQQLGRRDTYTPRDAAPVPGSVAAWLNSSERVGAVPRSFKTRSNSSEEHLTGTGGAGAEVETRRHESRPLYKGIQEVIRAIPPRAEARGILAHV